MNGDMDKIRMYMICKIVLGPDVDMLIKDLGGASPPDPDDDYNMLMKERESLMKEIKKAILDYKKLGPENLLGLRSRGRVRITGKKNQIIRTNINYGELKQLIETEVDAHNLRVDEFEAPPLPKLRDDCKIDIDHETRVTGKLPKFIDWDEEKKQYKSLMANAFPDWLDISPEQGGGAGKRGSDGQLKDDPEDDGEDESEDDGEGDGGDDERTPGKIQKHNTNELFVEDTENPWLNSPKRYIPNLRDLPEIIYTKPEGYKKLFSDSQAEDFALNVLKPLINNYAPEEYESYQENNDNDYPAYSLFKYLLLPSNENEVFADLGTIINKLAEAREEAREIETSFSAVFGAGGEEYSARLKQQQLLPLPLPLPLPDTRKRRSGGNEEVSTSKGPKGPKGARIGEIKQQFQIPNQFQIGAMGGSRKKTSKKAKKKKPQENKKSKKLNKRKN
jgi:hypothetical protein